MYTKFGDPSLCSCIKKEKNLPENNSNFKELADQFGKYYDEKIENIYRNFLDADGNNVTYMPVRQYAKMTRFEEININDLKKIMGKQNVNTDDENRRKLDKKIRTRDEMSSQKIRSLIDEMKLDNSSVKIVVKSPKPSTPKLQSRLDAWVKKN